MKTIRALSLLLGFAFVAIVASACVFTEKNYNPTDESCFVFTEVDGGYSVALNSEAEIPEDVVIPKTYNGQNVVAIADKGFYAAGIKTIKIPATVEHIGSVAFSSCSSLKSVTIIDGGLKSIGDYAFYSCSNLSDIELPESLVSIGKSSFENTAVCSVKLQRNVVSVGENAFKGCESLASVYIGMNVSSIGDGAFKNCNTNIKFTISQNNSYYELVDNSYSPKNS